MTNQLLWNPKTQNGFSLYDIVYIECLVKGMKLENRKFKAVITGKIKNAKAYIINVTEIGNFYPEDELNENIHRLNSLKSKYGYPIRQIELEWGRFSGSVREFVVSEHELKSQ